MLNEGKAARRAAKEERRAGEAESKAAAQNERKAKNLESRWKHHGGPHRAPKQGPKPPSDPSKWSAGFIERLGGPEAPKKTHNEGISFENFILEAEEDRPEVSFAKKALEKQLKGKAKLPKGKAPKTIKGPKVPGVARESEEAYERKRFAKDKGRALDIQMRREKEKEKKGVEQDHTDQHKGALKPERMTSAHKKAYELEGQRRKALDKNLGARAKGYPSIEEQRLLESSYVRVPGAPTAQEKFGAPDTYRSGFSFRNNTPTGAAKRMAGSNPPAEKDQVARPSGNKSKKDLQKRLGKSYARINRWEKDNNYRGAIDVEERLNFTDFVNDMVKPIYEDEQGIPKCPPGYKFDRKAMSCVPKRDKDRVGNGARTPNDLKPGNGAGYNTWGASGYDGAGYAWEEKPTSSDMSEENLMEYGSVAADDIKNSTKGMTRSQRNVATVDKVVNNIGGGMAGKRIKEKSSKEKVGKNYQDNTKQIKKDYDTHLKRADSVMSRYADDVFYRKGHIHQAANELRLRKGMSEGRQEDINNIDDNVISQYGKRYHNKRKVGKNYQDNTNQIKKDYATHLMDAPNHAGASAMRKDRGKSMDQAAGRRLGALKKSMSEGK